MRKLFYLAVLLSACSQPDMIQETSMEANKQGESSMRSFDEALEIAQGGIRMLEDAEPTRMSSTRRTFNLVDGVKYVTSQQTRTGDTDTLMYVFNFSDEKGYAIVSADRRMEGLLAVTESGYYDPSQTPSNPGLELYMSGVRGNLDSLELLLPDPHPGFMQLIIKHDTVGRENIAPRVLVKWGQDNPEGRYCPNNTAGCCNTAMAMIMSYFKYPQSIALTYSGADIPEQELDWEVMCNHTVAPSCYAGCTPESHNAIGRLCRQLGQMSSSTYHANDGTSSTINNSRSTMSRLGYEVGGIISSTANLATNLWQGRLIFMSGLNSQNEGHAWVVDGYKSFTVHYQEYTVQNGLIQDVYCDEYKTTSYNHINWGWDGSDNGYFLSNVFNANSVGYLDNGCSKFDYDERINFTKNFKYFTVYHE